MFRLKMDAVTWSIQIYIDGILKTVYCIKEGYHSSNPFTLCMILQSIQDVLLLCFNVIM